MQVAEQIQDISSHERISEIASLLAIAIKRKVVREFNENRNFPLDFAATPSMYGQENNPLHMRRP